MKQAEELDKCILHELNEQQKIILLKIYVFLSYKSEPILHHIIMCDENWFVFNNCKCLIMIG
ncbi:hypothetical protein X975_06895, partial [Stegodyphus mimosarum]